MPSNIQYVFGAPDPMCVCLCFFFFILSFCFCQNNMCFVQPEKRMGNSFVPPNRLHSSNPFSLCIVSNHGLFNLIVFHLSSILTTCCCWFFLLFFSPNSSCDETSNYLMHMLWKFSNKNPAIYCYCFVLWSSHVVMLIHKFSNLCVNSVSFILSLPSISLTE